ncbi:8471_t:CDS:2, partial [Racocetra fulgida]
TSVTLLEVDCLSSQMSPIMEEILSDSNSVLTSDEPLSNPATSSERSTISPFHTVKNGKRPYSSISLPKEDPSEEEELDQPDIRMNSDHLDHNESIVSRNDISAIPDDKEYSGYRRKYGNEGTEPFLDNLASTMGDDPGFMLSSIQCVKLCKDLRDKVGGIMQLIKPKLKY